MQLIECQNLRGRRILFPRDDTPTMNTRQVNQVHVRKYIDFNKTLTIYNLE